MKTNLLTTIKTAAETAGYKFMYGDGRYFEQAVSSVDLTDGSIGLMFNINQFSTNIEQERWNGEIVYDCQFFMFRKWELTTFSSLSETKEQKFEARMDELQNELLKFITGLTQCTNDIDLLSPRYTPGYNITAANADGWFLDCSLRLQNQWPV